MPEMPERVWLYEPEIYGECGSWYHENDDQQGGVPYILEAKLAEVERERDALTQGPYEAYQCRNHWHVGTGGSGDGSSYDEAGAKAEAARRNAANKQDLELARAEVVQLRADLRALVPLARLGWEALQASREGYDYEGADIQQHAETFGVITPEPVNPEWLCQRHETCECELGDICYRNTEATTRARAVLDRLKEGT